MCGVFSLLSSRAPGLLFTPCPKMREANYRVERCRASLSTVCLCITCAQVYAGLGDRTVFDRWKVANRNKGEFNFQIYFY